MEYTITEAEVVYSCLGLFTLISIPTWRNNTGARKNPKWFDGPPKIAGRYTLTTAEQLAAAQKIQLAELEKSLEASKTQYTKLLKQSKTKNYFIIGLGILAASGIGTSIYLITR